MKVLMFPIKQRYKNLSKSQQKVKRLLSAMQMFPIKQRYKNLSKSQRGVVNVMAFN